MFRTVCLLLATLTAVPSVFAAADPQPSAPQLSPEERQQGFVSLFDGKTLNGWQGATKGYAVENGVLVCLKKGGGNLYTTKQYGDFIFRFEFKLEPGGNNGIGIRTPLAGRPSAVAMEIQILDDDHPKYKNLQPWQYHGSIYGVVPAKRGYLKPAGQWNSQEIRCQGYRITVTLNGTVIVDADLEKLGFQRLNDKPGEGLKNKSGHIALLGHNSRVEFRNLRIKPLD